MTAIQAVGTIAQRQTAVSVELVKLIYSHMSRAHVKHGFKELKQVSRGGLDNDPYCKKSTGCID
jgi:hypothetical protein